MWYFTSDIKIRRREPCLITKEKRKISRQKERFFDKTYVLKRVHERENIAWNIADNVVSFFFFFKFLEKRPRKRLSEYIARLYKWCCTGECGINGKKCREKEEKWEFTLSVSCKFCTLQCMYTWAPSCTVMLLSGSSKKGLGSGVPPVSVAKLSTSYTCMDQKRNKRDRKYQATSISFFAHRGTFVIERQQQEMKSIQEQNYLNGDKNLRWKQSSLMI